ncbi:MAG: MFS transporter, partial [Chloroflexota bacterium]
FMAVLGASATVVGIVSGLGELVGYGLRLVSGFIADRTQRYWAITLVGYAVNMLAVPLLALAGSWQVAAVLIVVERTGKAMRNPPRDAMLSHATSQIGRGWGFGLHEALDQLGAVLGPLLVAGVLAFRGDYRTAFAALLISAVLALAVLVAARITYPAPREFEAASAEVRDTRFPRAYWLYLAAVAFVAAGYADFPLIAYHFQKASILSADRIPLFYAIAMGADALAALLFGRLFDRIGLTILIVVSLVSALFAPLVFFGGFSLALIGMVCWGVGMGAQESIMRAAIGDFVPANRRGSAYGVFNAGYGLFWFLGSALIGILYDTSIPWLVIFSAAAQLASIPVFLAVRRELSLRTR